MQVVLRSFQQAQRTVAADTTPLAPLRPACVPHGSNERRTRGRGRQCGTTAADLSGRRRRSGRLGLRRRARPWQRVLLSAGAGAGAAASPASGVGPPWMCWRSDSQ
jgi:hypothetical protein